MSILLKNAIVYAPKCIGKKDILIVGGEIIYIDNSISYDALPFAPEIIDVAECPIIPGIIDQHVHIIGGGGEGGFHTRTPEASLSKLTSAGITTVVGLLGTDGTARNLEALYAKTSALNTEGITAYMLTGSYEYPSVTLTGSVRRDMILIDKVIGVKIAHSDHRSSFLSIDEITRLVQDIRVGGMIGTKPGIVTIHMGDGKNDLQMIIDIVENRDTPIKHFRPTHLTRNINLFKSAVKFALLGGFIDFTSGVRATPTNGRIKVSKAIHDCLHNHGINPEHITVSSDGQGSAPVYDKHGNVTGVGIGELRCNHQELVDLVNEEGFDLSEALTFFTSNVAKALNIFPRKGSISQGADADIIIMDKDMGINTVIAKGEIAIRDKEIIKKGYFEV